jgi:large subunit ribosomal protein L1
MKIKRSKRYREAAKLVEVTRAYPVADAIKTLKSMPSVKFDQTVSLAFKLTVDPRQSDQMVRGTVALPNGSGKNVRVLVFAKGKAADDAKAAGAEHVGFEDMIKKCLDGFTDFDVAVATPEAMGEVRKLGKVLGPRGLMPNPKTGTVTDDTAKAVRECKAGRVEFKVDKAANLHVPVGKLSFTETQLAENAAAVIDAVMKARPASAKGGYVLRTTMSASQSPGVTVDLGSAGRN